jgi:16S rRNA (guanine(966)-N(2))-methyltransferase RsmD
MRVIAGEFRSRRLKSLPGLNVRPTPDRLRESLFNVLAPVIEGCVFLDAYAGTGAVGIEALSRGARRAIFLERNRAAAAIIRENLRQLGLEARAQLQVGRVLEWLPRMRADIIFLDPPYDAPREYAAALDLLGELNPGLVVVQHDVHLRLADSYGSLQHVRDIRHSDNVLSFFRPVPGAASQA